MGVIIRQSIKGTIVNYIGSFIGFLTTMFVVTKFLKPEEFGLTVVIYEAAALIAMFSQLGTSASAMRFFPYFKDPQNNNNGFFFYLLLLPAIGALIFIPFYLFLKTPIIAYFSQNASSFGDYYYWVIPLSFFCLYWGVFETYSTLQMRIVVPKLIREVGVRVFLLAVYLLFAFGFLNLTGLVRGVIIVYAMAMFLTLAYVIHIAPTSLKHDFSYINKPLRRKIWNYTLFLVLGSLSGSILPQLDLFMVGSQMGLGYAGIYRVAFYIAVIIEIPYRSLSSISSPMASRLLKDGDWKAANKLYQKVALHQLIAGSSIFTLVWINIDNIFSIIPNGDIYALGKWVVFYLALSRIIATTLSFGGVLVSFSKYYYWGLFFSVFITIIGIITNLLLIPQLGITGAAVASLITSFLSYLVQQWVVITKIKGNPYTVSLIRQIFLTILLLIINFVLPQWAENPFIDGIYRTIIISSLAIALLYKFRISDDLCMAIDNFLLKKKHSN